MKPTSFKLPHVELSFSLAWMAGLIVAALGMVAVASYGAISFSQATNADALAQNDVSGEALTVSRERLHRAATYIAERVATFEQARSTSSGLPNPSR